MQYDKCPTGKDSWCSYNKALPTTGINIYKQDCDPLSQDVLAAIKPVYEDLSEDELLIRCLGGHTQNNNESLNQLMWKIAPKKWFGSNHIVEIAAYVGASVFNEGPATFLHFLHELGVGVGPSAHHYVQSLSTERIDKANKKKLDQTKEARTRRKQELKEAMDNIVATGEMFYAAGIDDSV